MNEGKASLPNFGLLKNWKIKLNPFANELFELT
ncbi:hypothetical protein PEDI_38980 [Persicobacter diffluens]|uniref:Uncharacterized protein n=1 Tax=Persicobacter diffluens TaxID=981 RepID=A0AAN4W282_9BACT|nr:hypothetical protein PEDI_38980 [Persicobacter diffluens]